MSRHRHAYDEDDLYDDYYDDDYYEEEAYPPQGQSSGGDASSSALAAPPQDVDADLCATFVIESLGQAHLSQVRVKQMLAMYGYDIEKTIAYFANEKATPTPAAATAAPKAKAVPVSLKAPSAKASKGISLSSGTKPAAAKAAAAVAAAADSASTSTSQLAQDLDGMGLGELGDLGSLGGGDPAQGEREAVGGVFKHAVAASALLADSAPLSDDEYQESTEAKAAPPPSHLTVVVAGHVDAGKSTLVGNLLYKTGQITQRTVHKFQKESGEMGKGSFALAWVMDESPSEREHGVTINVAERTIVSEGRVVTILDAPGHRDYIPNMISGAAQADAALLVVPAGVGEFESSVGARAQTREHAVLLKALGVAQLIVVVNKMDMTVPAWSQERFAYIRQQLLSLLLELQFERDCLRFAPVSGLGGENLVSLSDACPLRAWYSGPTLLEAIHALKEPARQVSGMPFRAVIKSVGAENARGCEVRATVLQGRLARGRGVGLASASGAATVKSITTDDGTALPSLQAGETATLVLLDRSGRTGEEMDLCTGMVLCKGPPLAACCRRFKASILTLHGLATPIIPGFSFELYLHGEEVPCRVERIYSMSGPEGGKIKAPKCVPGDRQAYVLIVTARSVCIEPIDECRALGRFALRSKGCTAAVGECRKVGPNSV